MACYHAEVVDVKRLAANFVPFVQRGLIAFNGEDVVGVLVTNRLASLGLAVHRIEGRILDLSGARSGGTGVGRNP